MIIVHKNAKGAVQDVKSRDDKSHFTPHKCIDQYNFSVCGTSAALSL